MANFLHGTETIEIESGINPVTEVRTGIIGLVGIAPKGPKNLTLVKNEKEAAQFGNTIPGFTIPYSLKNSLAQGAGTFIVVNVFDEAKHTEEKTETLRLQNGEITLSSAPLSPLEISNEDDSPTVLVEGTDYSLTPFGKFSAIKGRIPEGKVLKFAYQTFKENSVLPADVIGAVEQDGTRTGIRQFDLCFNRYGFTPKILIAPGFSELPSISNELLIAAAKYKGVALIDGDSAKSANEIITMRGPIENSNFSTSDQRAILLYPQLKAYDEGSNENKDFPYSSFYAGLMAKTDNTLGYWHSPSNKELKGVTGISKEISASINDTAADTNVLNGAGITTVFNSFGTGILAWGNRNAFFPTSASPKTFITMRRIADVVHESLEQAAMQFIDRPITQALIDDMRQTGNNFLKVLISRGAILEGSKIIYDKSDNTPETLASGKVYFRIVFMGAIPAETITFLSYVDTALYATIK